MEIAISIILGICLASAAGFRVFIPLLITSIASMLGYVNLSGGYQWVGSIPALITFGVASIIELGGYYSPWVDNVLDIIAAPLAAVSGIILSASVIEDMNPLLKWTLVIIAGGGTATTIHILTAKTRALASVFTGGLGNPILSTIEAFVSIVITVLSVLIPLLGIVLVLVILLIIFLRYKKKKREHG
jgi:hypothetical protein